MWAHGALTSHNVFLTLPEDITNGSQIRVYLDGIELFSLKKYACMFGSYKPTTVWSSPEVLKAKKNLQDPAPSMDVYSFGMLMWELFHE